MAKKLSNGASGSIEEKQFLKRLEERLERVQMRHQIEVTDFLEPGLQAIAEGYLRYQGQPFLFCGGHISAERKKLVIYPEYIEADCALAELVLVRLKGNFAYVQVNHRDFLGAVLSLGVKREKFGDFYVVEDGCFICTTTQMADYLLDNVPKIKGVGVTATVETWQGWMPPVPEQKMMQVMVNSMRLDTLLAHGFNLSRAKAMDAIQGGKVKVNHLDVNANDFLCKDGDILSFRGNGKLKIGLYEGDTKKGKMRITLWKYI